LRYILWYIARLRSATPLPEARAEDRQAAFAPLPLVLQVQGGPSPDGRALLVEAVTAEGEMLRFAVALTDVQHLVAFLLAPAGKVSATQGLAPSSTNPAASMSLPIPVTAIDLGEPVGDEGYLGISVGQAELVFSVPMSAFDPLGRTMLTLSAQSDPQ
jgi:hypothetical protein